MNNGVVVNHGCHTHTWINFVKTVHEQKLGLQAGPGFLNLAKFSRFSRFWQICREIGKIQT
jgi:hypothetical protein